MRDDGLGGSLWRPCWGGDQSSWSDGVRLVGGLWELGSEGLVNERGNPEEESKDFVEAGKEGTAPQKALGQEQEAAVHGRSREGGMKSQHFYWKSSVGFWSSEKSQSR